MKGCSPIDRSISFAALSSFALSLGVLVVSFLLDQGYWVGSAGFRGPFEPEAPGTKAYVTPLQSGSVSRMLFDASGDTGEWPGQPRLRAFVNSRELGPAGTSRGEIRRWGAGRFGYYDSWLVFSLPEGTPDDSSTHLRVEHRLHVKPRWRALAWSVAAAGGAFLLLRAWKRPRNRMTLAVVLITAVGCAFRVALACAAVAAAVYLLATGHGLARHYALPNAALLLANPGLRTLAEHERFLPYLVLGFGLLGSTLSWIASIRPATMELQRDQERTLTTLWHWSAPPIIVALYLLSVAGPWTGLWRRGDFSFVALGGVVPFSDAYGHFAGPLRQLISGRFDSWVERRLVAAAMRSALTLVVSYSATAFLLLQVTGVGIATWASARAVTRWRGVWAGVTYFGLIYVLVRPFLPTFLTEAPGVFWGLASIPFVVRALRTSSVTPAASALLLLCLALLTRMGSMLTIPAFASWMIWTADATGRRRVIAGGAALLVITMCIGLAWSLSRLYGSGEGQPGSNIAPVLCGVAHGGTWDDCERLYASELAGQTEAGRASVYYRKAWEATIRQPRRALTRLAEGELHYLLTAA